VHKGGVLHQPPDAHGSATLSFVIRSEAADLQFRRPGPGVFIEEAIWALKPVGRPTSPQPGRGHRFPNIVRALWARHTLTSTASLHRKTFPGRACRTADPSASLGMTKGRVVLPSGFIAWDREQQVAPLRFAPVGMTILFGCECQAPCADERGVIPIRSFCLKPDLEKSRSKLTLDFYVLNRMEQTVFHGSRVGNENREARDVSARQAHTAEIYGAFILLHNPFTDPEAQAGTLGRFGGKKRFKQPLSVLGTDA